MYYGSATVDRSRLLWGSWRTLLHMHWSDAACALTRWQHFSAWNDVMAAILKVEYPTLHSMRTVFTWRNYPAKFNSHRSDLKRQSFRLLTERRPNNKTKNKKKARRKTTITRWVAIWNQFLIQNATWQVVRLAITIAAHNNTPVHFVIHMHNFMTKIYTSLFTKYMVAITTRKTKTNNTKDYRQIGW